MIFAFRADASLEIGSGHIIRCLTLANALKLAGHDCFFICRNHLGNLIEYLNSLQWKVLELPTPQHSQITSVVNSQGYMNWLGVTQADDAQDTLSSLSNHQIQHIDWLIVDHYALSAEWEQALRHIAANILAIDDLANRTHDSDIILDCGLSNTQEHYQQLNKRPVTTLIGPRYALLRPEFAFYRQHLQLPRPTSSTIKLLINLGGIDKDDCTSTILDVLAQSDLSYPINTTIIMGINAPHKEKVVNHAKSLPFRNEVKINATNMGELMAQHDLAIGAAGSTAWERCCLGLPTIMICLADNQKMIAHELDLAGAAISLNKEEIKPNLESILKSITPARLLQMQNAALSITEGQGIDLLLKKMQVTT